MSLTNFGKNYFPLAFQISPLKGNMTQNHVIWAHVTVRPVFLRHQHPGDKINVRFSLGPLILEFLNIYFHPAVARNMSDIPGGPGGRLSMKADKSCFSK